MQHTIEGRRDIRGGRLASDRRAAGNLSSGAAFRSLAYSADGTFLIAGAVALAYRLHTVGPVLQLCRAPQC